MDCPMSSGDSSELRLSEHEVLLLVHEFLHKRQLYASQVTLEQETGVINGDNVEHEDVRFVRQLVLDGQWQQTLDFVQPLTAIKLFDHQQFRFLVLRSQLMELLYLRDSLELSDRRSEIVSKMASVLHHLESLAPSKDHYDYLCHLISEVGISSKWSPSQNRVECFESLLPLLQPLFKSSSEEQSKVAENDRLVQLVIKGILYESCVDFCQHRASSNEVNNKEKKNRVKFTKLLDASALSDADLSLLSWLQSVPNHTFGLPFEQKRLNVNVERLKSNVATVEKLDNKKSTWNTSGMVANCLLEDHDTPNRAISIPGDVANDHNDKMPKVPNTPTTKTATTSATKTSPPTTTTKTSTSTKTPTSATTPTSGTTSTATPQVLSATKCMKDEEEQCDLIQDVMPTFTQVASLEDVQAIRCASFDSSGEWFAVGSNSKTLRICSYSSSLTSSEVSVALKRPRVHKGSIYCLAWMPREESLTTQLIATGSNDKSVRVMRLDLTSLSMESKDDVELTLHDGTVRDLVFTKQHLVSAGAGDCRIHVVDVNTFKPVVSLTGHTGHVLGLSTWNEGRQIASGAQDGTVRLWDLRKNNSAVVIPNTSASAVNACVVDPSGRLLVTGHEDACCTLFDIHGQRCVQSMQPHSSAIRSTHFSSNALYLLTAGYDNKLVLTNLRGDLTRPLLHANVAEHRDKVICGKWHPEHLAFLSTSADKTCVLWKARTDYKNQD